MMFIRPSGPAIVLTMALLAGAFVAGASPQSSATRATWHGLKTVVQTTRRCEATNDESFVWVEEIDVFSASRWVSKRVRWDNKGSCSKPDLSVLKRRDVNWSIRCVNRGVVDLMNWHGAPVHPQCHETEEIFGTISPGVFTGPPNFSPVGRSQLRDGCTYNNRSVTANGDFRAVTTESITLDEANVSAKVFPNSAVEPYPGETFLHVEGRANLPVRWKFVLVESSRLRGYATNADVDQSFFERFDLRPLHGSYGTMDPDLIFDPSKYEPPWDQTRQWKRPYPDSGPHKWSILESNDESTSVSVNVLAMDYGAHGELQVFVSSKCGGGWLRVEPDETTGAAGISLPPDDADGNFIPDSFKEYAGRAALEDNDGEPVGDGTAGDGLTAFEEYRGFVMQFGLSCPSRFFKHERTNPAVKDLFVHVADPVLWRASGMGTGGPLESASGVAVHLICPAQYIDDETRIVNFTMQVNAGEGIRGAKLSQDFPQHGLHLVNEALSRAYGRSFGRNNGTPIGPPRNIDRVAVDVTAISASVGNVDPMAYIQRTSVHEMGHAIGVRHHGDANLQGPVVLLNMKACPSGMSEGTVAGDRACVATNIALRGGQNSGNASCPMKYVRWHWYVPPMAELVPAGPVDFRPTGSYSWLRRRELPGYVSRIDQVHQYRKDLDDAIIAQAPWKFCVAPTGTGINALPRDENHAGNSPRYCAHQIRVNDKPDN
jgi:hypothetical protein